MKNEKTTVVLCFLNAAYLLLISLLDGVDMSGLAFVMICMGSALLYMMMKKK